MLKNMSFTYDITHCRLECVWAGQDLRQLHEEIRQSDGQRGGGGIKTQEEADQFWPSDAEGQYSVLEIESSAHIILVSL